MSTLPQIPFEVYLEITNKKAQYGQYLDTKQWDRFQQIALPDAKFRFLNPDKTVIFRNGQHFDFASRSSFVEWFRKLFEGAQTLHMFGPPAMSLQSEDEVLVTWAMEDQLNFPETSNVAEIRGGGYYSEIWVRIAGFWWLKDLTLTRTYQKVGLQVVTVCAFHDQIS